MLFLLIKGIISTSEYISKCIIIQRIKKNKTLE
jgi:hypothetical protein